jgi:hypothetical protein
MRSNVARQLRPTSYFSDEMLLAPVVFLATPDETAPTLDSATIDSAGTSITLAFDETVVVGAGGNGGFTVSLAGGACTLTYSSGSGTSSLIYTTSRTITRNDAGTLDYVQPGNGIEDGSGNDLASFSDEPLVNDSTANTAPTDISLSNNAVLTTAGINAVVGTLSTTDPDYGDTFTYTLVAGTGDTDNASFNITGANLRCSDPNALGAGTYSVRIQTDDGADTFAEPFTITVLEPGTGSSSYGFTSDFTHSFLRFRP